MSSPGHIPEIRLSPRDPRFVLMVLLVAALVAVPFLGSSYLVGLATRVLILAIAAASLDLLLGYGGMVSFGHAAFLGVGGYAVAAWASQGVDNGFVHFASALAGAVVAGLAIGAVSLRTSGLYFIMITFAFAQMLFYLGVSLEPLGGDDGVNVRASQFAGVRLSDHGGLLLYFVALSVLVAVVFGLRTLAASRFGFVIRGCRSNETRMRAIGFPTFRYRLAAFVIAAVICSVAGALLASHQQFVSPSYMGWLHSGELLVMVILGGMGTIYGSVLGAIALVGLEELFILYAGKDYWMMVLGPVLILIVVFARRGLVSLLPESWPGFGRFALRLLLLAAAGAAYLAALRLLPAHAGISPLHLILWPIAALIALKLLLRARRSARPESSSADARSAA